MESNKASYPENSIDHRSLLCGQLELPLLAGAIPGRFRERCLLFGVCRRPREAAQLPQGLCDLPTPKREQTKYKNDAWGKCRES
jgi:hypothetical protein